MLPQVPTPAGVVGVSFISGQYYRLAIARNAADISSESGATGILTKQDVVKAIRRLG
jgi:hypothetical protein